MPSTIITLVVKLAIVTLFLFISICSSAQNIETIKYANSVDGYSFEYPSEWDSTAFAQLKAEYKMNFGAIIKPDFNSNKTGGVFYVTQSASYGAELTVHARETAASLKRVYPDAIIMESKQMISKNGIAYHSLITRIKESGSTRVTTKIQILKGGHIYSFDFLSPEAGHKRLSSYYQIVINSFKFQDR